MDKFNQFEIKEKEFLINHEVLENGLKVLSIENLKIEEAELENKIITLEENKFVDIQDGDSEYNLLIDSLQNALEKADGILSAEVISSIQHLGDMVHASYRGIYVTSDPTAHMNMDGIIYVNAESLNNPNETGIKKEILSIENQLKSYTY